MQYDRTIAGGVFTRDINKALKVVDNVRAGTMWINTYNLTDTGAFATLNSSISMTTLQLPRSADSSSLALGET